MSPSVKFDETGYPFKDNPNLGSRYIKETVVLIPETNQLHSLFIPQSDQTQSPNVQSQSDIIPEVNPGSLDQNPDFSIKTQQPSQSVSQTQSKSSILNNTAEISPEYQNSEHVSSLDLSLNSNPVSPQTLDSTNAYSTVNLEVELPVVDSKVLTDPNNEDTDTRQCELAPVRAPKC